MWAAMGIQVQGDQPLNKTGVALGNFSFATTCSFSGTPTFIKAPTAVSFLETPN